MEGNRVKSHWLYLTSENKMTHKQDVFQTPHLSTGALQSPLFAGLTKRPMLVRKIKFRLAESSF